MPISRSRDERTVLDLFTEIAIVEHLLRNRYDQSAPAGMTTGQFGILTHFIRGGKSREKLFGRARAIGVPPVRSGDLG